MPRITLTASAAAQDAQVGQVAYGLGKAGVNGLVPPMLGMPPLNAVPEGAWVEGNAEVLRETRKMIFIQGLLHVDGKRSSARAACSGSGQRLRSCPPDPRPGWSMIDFR